MTNCKRQKGSGPRSRSYHLWWIEEPKTIDSGVWAFVNVYSTNAAGLPHSVPWVITAHLEDNAKAYILHYGQVNPDFQHWDYWPGLRSARPQLPESTGPGRTS